MRLLNQSIGAAYVWAIALLSLLAVLSAYELQRLPVSLIASVAIASAADAAIPMLVHKHRPRIPLSGIITGLIIGMVAPIGSPLAAIVLADLAAVLSKHFIKARHTNIFNPAALGLLLALALFGIGDEWWGAGSYNVFGLVLSATPLLVVASYEAKRLTASLAFIAVSLVVYVAYGHGIGSLQALDPLLFSVNYLFAFVMLADPKTSPHPMGMQLAYGSLVAVLYSALAISAVPYSLLIALLSGNAAYALHRLLGRRHHAAAQA
ncbi:MAG: RnfABCDGE type electron transport complex subunit D [Candidatus Micrarchaeota archaeon]|nr:RnfABCDGE type electron transport complex subunit D [Candidatus Micrarchaeota archaeon]